MVICPNCGTVNPEWKDFCYKCGRNLRNKTQPKQKSESERSSKIEPQKIINKINNRKNHQKQTKRLNDVKYCGKCQKYDINREKRCRCGDKYQIKPMYVKWSKETLFVFIFISIFTVVLTLAAIFFYREKGIYSLIPIGSVALLVSYAIFFISFFIAVYFRIITLRIVANPSEVKSAREFHRFKWNDYLCKVIPLFLIFLILAVVIFIILILTIKI